MVGTRRAVSVVVGAGLTLLLVACSNSGGGLARPGQSSSTSTAAAVPAGIPPDGPGAEEGPEPAWTVDFSAGENMTPPVISGDTVVIGDGDGVLGAFERDGSERWQQQLEDAAGNPLEDVWTPVVVGGVVVTGGTTGELYSRAPVAVGVDLEDGSVLWRFQRFDYGPYMFAPAVAPQQLTTDGRLVFTASQATVYALDPATGRPRWTADVPAHISSYWKLRVIGDLLLASRASVAVLSTSPTIALEPSTGRQRWEFEGEVVHTAGGFGELMVLELITPGRSGAPRSLVALERDGTRRWSIPAGKGSGALGMASVGDTVVTVSQEELLVFDAGPDGAVRWRVQSRENLGERFNDLRSVEVFSTPPLIIGDTLVVGGFLSFSPLDDTAFVRAYDLADGTVLSEWRPDGDGAPIGLDHFEDGELAIVVAPGRVGERSLVALDLASASRPADDDAPALLGIPSPSDALTAKNAAYAAGILAALLVLVAIPTTLFNSALDQHLEALQRYRLRRRSRRAVATDETAAPPRDRSRWTPVLVYSVIGAVLFSLLEPSWGANSATVVTAVSFWVALAVLTSVGIGVTAGHERARYQASTGRPVFSFATLAFAALCVAGSRAIAFVPGYLYGVLVSYRTATKLTESDEADIQLKSAVAVLTVAACGWGALDVFEDAFGTSGFGSLPTGVAAGLFMAGVETLLIGLLPLPLLPGELLRTHHPVAWKGLWATSAFLFILAVLHPGIASAEARSTGWVLAGAAVYGSIAVGFWWFTSRRGATPAPVTEEPASPALDEPAEAVPLG